MILKNENEINKNICQSVIKSMNGNYDAKVLYFMNSKRILSCRALNLKELENANQDEILNSRIDYINAFGIIASTVEIRIGDGIAWVDFHVTNRSSAKTKISWEYAEAVDTITNKQYLKEDFKTQKCFAEAANLNGPYISTLRAAIAFRRSNKNNPEIQKFDIYHAAVLNSVGSEIDFFVEINGGYEAIRQMSQRQLKEEVSEFKGPGLLPDILI